MALLSAVLSKFDSDCAPGVVRVVFAARLVSDADRNQITENILGAIAGSATGLVLLYPRVALGCVEAETTDQALAGLLALQVLESPRVLLCTDATRRFFPAFAVEAVALGGGAQSDFKPTETVLELAAECAVALSQLGAVLSEAGAKGRPCKAAEMRPDLVPVPAKVDFLTRQEQLEPLTQFVVMLRSEVVPGIMDGELVWPVPQRLFPYD